MTIKRASMIGWCAAALLCCVCAYGQTNVNMQYFYDSAGRLTLAVDSTGVAIQYVYDADGNITQINRTAGVGSLAILNFTPQQGAVGSRVTIQGSGFNPSVTGNTVKFNGVIAVVLSATTTSIVAVVPSGATTGLISVAAGSNTVMSSSNFTVVATTPQTTPPTVTITSPVTNAAFIKGQTITLTATVTSPPSPPNAITYLDFSVNGNYLMTNVQSSTSTFSRNFTLPYGVANLTFAARAFDNQGNVGFAAPVTATLGNDLFTTVTGYTKDKSNTPLTASVQVLQNGLKAEFFTSNVPSQLSSIPGLTTPDQTKLVSALDFLNPPGTSGGLFGSDTFGLAGPSNFGARFKGTVTIPATGSYSFTLSAAGNAQLLVNGTTTVFNYNGQFGQIQGTVTLSAGAVPIEVDYLNANSQIPQLQLSWSSAVKAVGPRQVVPQTSLQPAPGLFGTTSASDGSYTVSGVPAALGRIWVDGTYSTRNGVVGYFPPAPGATTNAGTMIIGILLMSSLGVGGGSTCGITPAGQAYCWGNNPSGGLGNGTFTSPWNTPQAVVAPTGGSVLNFAAIYPGKDTSCGLTMGAAAYCWGNNADSQFGNGGGPNSNAPVAVSPTPNNEPFTQLSVGYHAVCGVTGTNRGYCWGSGDNNELGNSSNASESTPQLVQGGLGYTAIAIGGDGASFGTSVAGPIYNWGYPECGSGYCGGVNGLPTEFHGPGGATSFTVATLSHGGGYFTCALDANGSAYCWGENGSGQLGNGSISGTGTPTAVAAPAGGSALTFASISTGDSHACGITTSGATYCWGDNSTGELGTGNTTDSHIPILVSPPAGQAMPLSFVSIGAGSNFTCGLTQLGTAYCWGVNGDGQLGNGNYNNSSLPVLVAAP
jgi:YD repeat-containing protein